MNPQPWRPHSTVRYRPDVGFELRCPDCIPRGQCYWPLALEFWNPGRGMTRCRACWQRKDTAYHRASYQRDPLRRARLKARSARNRRQAKVAALHCLRRAVAA